MAVGLEGSHAEFVGQSQGLLVVGFGLYRIRGVTMPGKVTETARTPEEYGVQRCRPEDLAGGDAEHNASELQRVFSGEDKRAHRDALLMGTSLVLEVAGSARDLKHGVEMAAAALDGGDAAAFLERLRKHFQGQ